LLIFPTIKLGTFIRTILRFWKIFSCVHFLPKFLENYYLVLLLLFFPTFFAPLIASNPRFYRIFKTQRKSTYINFFIIQKFNVTRSFLWDLFKTVPYF
jgi:hypothetical protein